MNYFGGMMKMRIFWGVITKDDGMTQWMLGPSLRIKKKLKYPLGSEIPLPKFSSLNLLAFSNDIFGVFFINGRLFMIALILLMHPHVYICVYVCGCMHVCMFCDAHAAQGIKVDLAVYMCIYVCMHACMYVLQCTRPQALKLTSLDMPLPSPSPILKSFLRICTPKIQKNTKVSHVPLIIWSIFLYP